MRQSRAWRRRRSAATRASKWRPPTTRRRAGANCWTARSRPQTPSTRSSSTSNPPFSGGERDAINCLQLYRVTHDKKHLDLAKHYLDIRGLENSVNRSRHNQSHKPVLEQAEAVGHAVNCVSLMVSLADVGVLTGLKDYFTAAERLWLDVVEKKLYVTGGVGTTGNEGFGEPYSLPNISAYSETCAALMFITFNHRMFLATGDGKYIDVMERAMYNNALSGVSASGDRFFYVNRLASAGDGRDARWERASLECCPPNLVRFLASMPGFVYAQDARDAIYVNLYVSSRTEFTVGGQTLTLSVASEMPWGGRSTLTVSTRDDDRSHRQAAHSRLGAQRTGSRQISIDTPTTSTRRRPCPSTGVRCAQRRTAWVHLGRRDVEERRHGRRRDSRSRTTGGRPRPSDAEPAPHGR